MYLYNKETTYIAQNNYNNYLVRARIYLHENVIFDEIICVYKDNIIIGKLIQGEIINYNDESIEPIIELFNNDLKQMGYEI